MLVLALVRAVGLSGSVGSDTDGECTVGCDEMSVASPEAAATGVLVDEQ